MGSHRSDAHTNQRACSHRIKKLVLGEDLYMAVDLRARGAPPVMMFSPTLAGDPDVELQVKEGKGFFKTNTHM